MNVLLCQVDDSQKNSYFVDGLLLAISIVAVAIEEFFAESDEFLSDSYDLSFPIALKLTYLIANTTILGLIQYSFLNS
jgi:hypothetical protein